MQKFTVRPYSNIAQIGLQKLDGTLCELNEEIGNPDGIAYPNKKYYDPRKWLRLGEETFKSRLKNAFKDLNNINTL